MASEPRLVHFVAAYAAEMGLLLVAHGRLDAARRYLGQAEQAAAPNLVAHMSGLRTRRLRGLLAVAEGRADDGRAALAALRDEAVADGRTVLVDLIDADLARSPGTVGAPTAPAPGAPPVRVEVFGSHLAATVDGAAVPTLRGYPAKLLALLVASDGMLTIDAAIVGLWPDADLEVGRNRLHGILLRLRRSLGLPVAGPITCADGVVRLDRDGPVEVDAWAFERAAERSADTAAALVAYGDGVLTHQFTYDDTIEAYRRTLRATFLRVATKLLADPPTDILPAALADLARRAWRQTPDDPDLCLHAVRALAAHGLRAEARELVTGTVQALSDLGLDATQVTAAAAEILPPVPR